MHPLDAASPATGANPMTCRNCKLYDLDAPPTATDQAQPDPRDALIASLEAENKRLRSLTLPEWFYDGDDGDCGSDACRDSVWGVIDNHDLDPGHWLIEVATARQLPSIWALVRVFTNEEKDERESDDAYEFTEFASVGDARAALAKAEALK
jgi:hypothetical protein